MIDTGFFTQPSFDSLKTGLKNLGIAFTDITTIIITHVHPDHFGLAGRIKQLSPHTQVVMHRWESELVDSRYVHFFDLQEKLGAMLERHGVPHYDVSIFKSASMPTLDFVRVTFPDHSDWENLPVLQKRIAVMETIAHLENLRWESLTERTTRDDIIYYSLPRTSP